MPIQSVEHWQDKAARADEMAAKMMDATSRAAMLEIADLYRRLAEETRKLQEAQNK